MTTNILITGAGGQLGREFSALAPSFPDLNIFAHDQDELDLTRAGDIKRALAKNNYDYCINCAAYTAVDRAEQEAERARTINRDGVQNLGLACRETGTKLFHFSTDYVYHNHLNRPLLETDPTTPQNIYAQTKLAGEESLLSVLPSALILRTSWVYSSFGHNFVKTMLRLGKERSSLGIVCDQVGTPTYARDMARTCLLIIQQIQSGNRSWQGGVFNYSNEGVCSWYDFALAIFELSHVSCSVQPIESKDYPTPARRPFYSVLNKTKFKSVFQMTIPHWRDALQRCLREL
jgi:dTDP-4-dehydrorhamnose reductase